MRTFLLIGLILTILADKTTAQFYVQGQEPTSVKWLEVKSRSGVSLYSSSLYDTSISKAAEYFDQAFLKASESTNFKFKPVPIVLHTNSLLSNGFVSWAPKRIEIVTTHSIDSDPEPWLKTLAFHETQHVIQVERLNNGFFKVLSYVLGEQAPGIAVGFIPLWYLEGDAVYNETRFTNGGRGRDASFYQYYGTYLQEKSARKYSYDKWLLSSYKDYIPNHYQFGYQLVGYANLTFGDKVWDKTLDYVSRHPYTIFPFYFGLKKQTGLSRKKLFEESFEYLDSVFFKQKTEQSDFKSLINNKKYAEYSYPTLINDSILIALKTDLKHIPSFVKVDVLSGKEETILSPGVINGKISYGYGKALWSQFRAHPRWEYLNWSEIWVLNTETGKEKRITEKTKYVNPVFLNNNHILAIEQRSNGTSAVVKISLEGDLLESFEFPLGLEPKEITPSNGGKVFVRAVSDNGMVIIEIDESFKSSRVILGPLFRHISNICYANQKLYFVMTESFTTDMFELDLVSNKTSKVTNTKKGINNISYYKDNELIVSFNSIKGELPAVVKLNPEERVEVEITPFAKGLYGESFNAKSINDEKIEKQNFIIKDYKGIKTIFNFHSWAPLYYNPIDIINGYYAEIYPGVSMFSQNLTSTALTTLGYSFNETHGFHANFHWMKWYPTISAGIDVGNTFPRYYGGPNELTVRKYDTRLAGNISITIPVLLTSGHFITRLTPRVSSYYSNSWVWDNKREEYVKSLSEANISTSFYSLKRLAHCDLRSRLGIYLFANVNYSHSARNVIGPSVFSKTGIYLPGIATNHSLLITAQHEKHFLKQDFNANRATMPRGFTNIRYDRLTSANVDYSFPVLYPDLKLSSLAYIKRIFLNFFSDNAYVYEYEKNTEGLYEVNRKIIGSTGLEIYSDMHFLRTRYEFRMGYRFGRAYNTKDFFQSFLFTMNLESLFGFMPENQLIKYEF